jgi:Tol biopolymer transport system component/ABC-type branched-subunit amino acid transport system substrate-binding protein
MKTDRVISVCLLMSILVLAACAPQARPVQTVAQGTAESAAPTTLAANAATSTVPFTHTACAKGVDLTNQTISFDHIIDPGDQPDTVYNPLRAGYADAVEYFNAHDGICGAAVANDFDDKNWADVETSYQRFLAKTPKPVVIMLYGSGAGVAFAPKLAADQIPGLDLRAGSIGSVYGVDGKTLGWVFDTNPLYPDQVGAMCDYIAANPQRFPKPVLGFLGITDDWASEATTAGRSACMAKGIGDAGTATFDGNSTNIQPQVQKLVSAGATIIYSNSHENGPALIAKTLLAMGLQGKVTLAAVSTGMDAYSALFGQADLDADGVPAISGMIGSQTLRSLAETNHPGIQLIRAQADLHQRPLTLRTNGYTLAWATTDLLIETYIQTGNRVGFNQVNGAEFKKTLENMVYAPLGGVEQIDFQKGQRRALAVNRIGEMRYLGQDGKTPAGPGNPPKVVNEGGKPVMAPMILPLTDYQPVPDLRAGVQMSVEPIPATSTAQEAPASGPAPMGKVPGRIAFTSARDGNLEIYGMNGDGTGLTNLTKNPADDIGGVWSPDGKKILFMSNRDGNSEIYDMNADGSNPTNLTRNPANDGNGMPEGLNWSPDGKKILFISDRDSQNGKFDVFVMNADGSDPKNLTNTPDLDEIFPGWTGDGKHIAFTVDTKDGLWMMNSDGSNVTQFTNRNVEETFPRWSPDGKKIAYVNGHGDGTYEVYQMNADGSNPTALTNSPGHVDNFDPRWSPDGKQIIFWSSRDGNMEIYAMNADGSNQIRLTNSPGDDFSPMWQPK